MFRVGSMSGVKRTTGYYRGNWEADIDDVIVEKCDTDPSGFQAVYIKNNRVELHPANEDNHYCVGASFLKNRLTKLSRAGFDAPMTKKAINIIDQKRMSVLGGF